MTVVIETEELRLSEAAPRVLVVDDDAQGIIRVEFVGAGDRRDGAGQRRPLAASGSRDPMNAAMAPIAATPMIQLFASTSSACSCAGRATQPSLIARPTANVTR